MTKSKLPPTSAQKIRAKIDRADNFLTDGIKWLPTELQDGKRTKQEVEAILCQKSKEWAWDIFVTILREWAEIGIPPDDFEAIVKGQIESLSNHAEERVAAFVSGFQLSSGEVLRCVREFLPCLIPSYREENRFRFHSVTADGEAAFPSKPATPQAGGPATRADAQEQSQEAERTVDSAGRTGARIPSAAEGHENPGALVQESSDLRVDSDVPKQEDTKQRAGKARKGDATLLGPKRLVNFRTAEQYLGISERQRQKLINSGSLKVEGQGQNRKITAESLKAYLPPEIPN
jgi:hypothetical protein